LIGECRNLQQKKNTTANFSTRQMARFINCVFSSRLNEETAGLATGFEAVCVFVNGHVDAAVIAKLPSLGVRLIALRCAGYNNVDLAAATKHGITVVRVPAYSPYAVADNRQALVKMREGVMLINTSRGALLDTVAIIDGLKTGKIGYLGLDVYEEEGTSFLRMIRINS
jgi:lactate dehydrogenase-like 2-hydroxyacid dehydrogenase